MTKRGTNKNDKNEIDYEDSGSWVLYLWSWLAVLVMLAVIVLFGMLIAGFVVLTGAIIW